MLGITKSSDILSVPTSVILGHCYCTRCNLRFIEATWLVLKEKATDPTYLSSPYAADQRETVQRLCLHLKGLLELTVSESFENCLFLFIPLTLHPSFQQWRDGNPRTLLEEIEEAGEPSKYAKW